MAEIEIILTRHARDVLVERNLQWEWLYATIHHPDMIEPDPKRPFVVRAFRIIPERDGRVLRVAYVRAGETVRVLSVFFDRARRRKLARAEKSDVP